MPYKTPFPLALDEVCIDYETDVTAGELKVNDAYDLYLIEKGKPVREYKLVCFMNLQFFFQDKNGKWTSLEKKNFVTQWEQHVKSAWDRKVLKVLSSGVKVVLEVKFKTQIEGFWIQDHWELSVMKTTKFARSYVNTFTGNSQLDDKDVVLTPKNYGFAQRGVVHEFGHMLGLEDEYEAQSLWYKDKASIMNNGEVIKTRHIAHFLNWVNKKLQKHKIN